MSVIDKHFPPHQKLHKLFNRNNVKRSYSCLPNLKSIINAHNRKILYPSQNIARRTCNYINILQCLLQQKCLGNSILYQAKITPIGENSEIKFYYGINHRNRKSDTELSNKLWKIKDNKRSAKIT